MDPKGEDVAGPGAMSSTGSEIDDRLRFHRERILSVESRQSIDRECRQLRVWMSVISRECRQRRF